MANNILCISTRQKPQQATPHIVPLLPDARWILIPAGAKAPGYAGWQRGGYDAAAALAHAGRGGNLGVLCGPQSGGLIALDADSGAGDLLTYWPALAHTIRIWRADAPDRAKFLLRVWGARTLRDHNAGLEILAGTIEAGSNAVVWGRHPAGAQYQVAGDAVIDMPLHDLADLWKWRTGSRILHDVAAEAGAPTRPAVRHRADAGALAYDNQTDIATLLIAAGCRQSARNPRRWIPRESASGTDSLLHNAGTNTVWAFSAKNPLGREGLIYPHQLAQHLGVCVPKPQQQTAVQTHRHTADATAVRADTLEQLLAGWRHAALHGDLAPHWRAAQRRLAAEYSRRADGALRAVGDATTDDAAKSPAARAAYWRQQADAALTRAEATRWPEAALRKLMLSMLDLFAEGSSRDRMLSDLRIAAAANMARMTVRRHLDSLAGWFLGIHQGPVGGAGTTYTLLAGHHVVAIRQLTPKRLSKTDNIGLAPLATHYAHDAFAVGWTPLPDTAETWGAVCETAEQIRTGTTSAPDDTLLADYPPQAGGSMPPPMDDAELERLETWRRRCAAGYIYIAKLRMGADLASLGGRALLLMQRIADAGGQLDGAAAADAIGANRATLSRLVARCVDAGVLCQPEHGQIALAPDWVDSLECSVKLMPSYGMHAARTAAWLDSRIALLENRITETVRVADAHPQRADASISALERLGAALDDAEGERAALDVWADGNLPDTQRRRVLARHGTWDARGSADARQRRQRRLDRADAAAETQRQAAADAAAGITPQMRARADALYAMFGGRG